MKSKAHHGKIDHGLPHGQMGVISGITEPLSGQLRREPWSPRIESTRGFTDPW